MTVEELARDWRRLTETAGLYVDLSREVWRIEGPGAVRSLQGLLTNDVASPATGSRVPALVLTPKGRPLADVRVWKRPDHVLVDLPRVAGESLREHLGLYLPPRLARVSEEPGATVVRLAGPASAAVLEEAGAAGAPLAAPREAAEGGGYDILLLGPEAEEAQARLAGAVEAAGGGTVSAAAFDVWRVERGIPVFGRDFDGESLPQETGLVDLCVDFEKGCYTGQEVVARIHYRGHVNRHIRGLRLPGEPVAAEGDAVFHAGRERGRITSIVRSPAHGTIALAMIRREVEPGDRVSLSPDAEPTIPVVVLPFTFK